LAVDKRGQPSPQAKQEALSAAKSPGKYFTNTKLLL